MRRLNFISIFIMAGLFTSMAFAGVYMEGKSSTEKESSKMFMTDNALRMEVSGSDGDNIIIYRKDKDLCWIINEKEGAYFTITRADVERIGEMVMDTKDMINQQMQQLTPEQKAQLKQAVESMKNMPQAQRDMMMKMMPDYIKDAMEAEEGKSAAPAKKKYSKTKSGVNVNGFSATQFTATKGSQKLEDIYMAKLSSVNLSKSDVQVIEDFAGFMQAMTKMGGQEDSFFSLSLNEQEKTFGFAGVPVKSVIYAANGSVDSSNEITKIEKRSLSDDLFNVGSNLKEKKSPMDQMQQMQ